MHLHFQQVYSCVLVLFIFDDNATRILLTSTSEVYGDPLVHPQPETYWGNVNPIGKFYHRIDSAQLVRICNSVCVHFVGPCNDSFNVILFVKRNYSVCAGDHFKCLKIE